MKMTFHTTPPRHPTTPTHQRNSMSVIAQLLITRFWPNFKRRCQGLSWTDFNCHSSICPGNICPGNICPYQEYLSCYWPNFDETLKVGSWDYLEQISIVAVTFVQVTLVWRHLSISGISRYWYDFVKTVKEGSWDHFQQMLTVTVTFVQE